MRSFASLRTTGLRSALYSVFSFADLMSGIRVSTSAFWSADRCCGLAPRRRDFLPQLGEALPDRRVGNACAHRPVEALDHRSGARRGTQRLATPGFGSPAGPLRRPARMSRRCGESARRRDGVAPRPCRRAHGAGCSTAGRSSCRSGPPSGPAGGCGAAIGYELDGVLLNCWESERRGVGDRPVTDTPA